jgi:hypothetical protein
MKILGTMFELTNISKTGLKYAQRCESGRKIWMNAERLTVLLCVLGLWSFTPQDKEGKRYAVGASLSQYC